MQQPVDEATTSGQAPPPTLPWLDGLLAVGVLVLAGFLGSVAVRNSDVWQHLAAGRLIAQGDFEFGRDPFCFGTAEKYWVNHSWLFDWGLYETYANFDRTGVALVRAAHVLLIVVFLLLCRRAGSGFVLPAIGAAVALVAANSRLPALQSALVTYVWLAGLALLLYRGPTWRRRWLMPLLALVMHTSWVNHDAWFLLGPLIILVWGAGARLDRSSDGTPSVGIWLATLAAALVGCLLNPHLHRVWTMPDDLAPAFWDATIREDPIFRQFLAPQFAERHLERAGTAPTTASIILLAVGVVSFLINGVGRPFRRLFVWLVLAALSLWRVRYVPFFAFGATPLVVLNFQEALAGRSANGSTVLRLAALLGLAGLLVAAWPGWLGPHPDDPFLACRVRPTIESNVGLEQVAQQIGKWHKEGSLTPDDRCLNVTPEVAHYLAFFAPGSRKFIDARWSLHTDRAADFTDARKDAADLVKGGAARFASAVERNQCTYIVATGSSRGDGVGPARELWPEAIRFPAWAVAGRATAFGYVPAGRADPHPGLRWEPGRQAFAPQAPRSRPTFRLEEPRVAGPWEKYAFGPPVEPVEVDSASSLLLYSVIANAIYAHWNDAAELHNLTLALALSAAAAPLNLQPIYQEASRGIPAARLFGQPDRGPDATGAALLSLRSALASQVRAPDSPETHLRVAEACRVVVSAPRLMELQAVNAWTRARARWRVAEAYAPVPAGEKFSVANDLAQYHRSYNHLDLATETEAEALELLPEIRQNFNSAEQFDKEFSRRVKQLQDMQAVVAAQKQKFAKQAEGVSPVETVGLATQFGLPGEALAILDRLSAAKDESLAQINLIPVLDLMIRVGKADEALAILHDPKYSAEQMAHPQVRLAFRRLQVQAAAGCGDLSRARDELQGLVGELNYNRQAITQQFFPALAATVGGGPPMGLAATGQLVRYRITFEFMSPYRQTLDEEFEYRLWDGMLALQEGDTRAALKAFDQALGIIPPRYRMPGQPVAERYRALLKQYER